LVYVYCIYFVFSSLPGQHNTYTVEKGPNFTAMYNETAILNSE
jgi:hypothetical protein